MSNKSISSLKVQDVLLYIDEAEKYILDLIDIILLKCNESSNKSSGELSLFFNGLKTRGIFLDLAGKLSMFGHSKNASIVQSLNHEHLDLISQFINDGDTCIPSHLNPKLLKDGLTLGSILEHALRYKTETPPVSIKMNLKPTIDTLFSSPIKNPSAYTTVGLFKDDVENVIINNINSINNDDDSVAELEQNSSMNKQRDEIKLTSKRLLNEICGWTNSSPVIFPSSDPASVITNKIGKLGPLSLPQVHITEPPSKKIKIETSNNADHIDIIEMSNEFPIIGLPKKQEECKTIKLEDLIKETNQITKVLKVDFTAEVATPGDFKRFYSNKANHLEFTMATIKSTIDQPIDIQWELIQEKIKLKLIQVELDQLTGRLEKITAKRNGYQSYFLFLFEYPIMSIDGHKPRNDLLFKQVYCSSICQKLKISKTMAAWITRRSQSLSRTKIRLAAKKDNTILENIYLFGKRDYTQVFFDLTLIINAFSETLRKLLAEANKINVTTFADLNNGIKIPVTLENIKCELQNQFQLIYKNQTGLCQSPKIASLNIFSNAFSDLFSNI